MKSIAFSDLVDFLPCTEGDAFPLGYLEVYLGDASSVGPEERGEKKTEEEKVSHQAARILMSVKERSK
jgi:hypothetical protein